VIKAAILKRNQFKNKNKNPINLINKGKSWLFQKTDKK
jgi:hypothetical protein